MKEPILVRRQKLRKNHVGSEDFTSSEVKYSIKKNEDSIRKGKKLSRKVEFIEVE